MKKKKITFRVSEEEYETIKRKSETLNLSLSDYIRTTILKAKPVRKRKLEDCKQYNKLLFEINKIGVNLNQVAKYCNVNKSIDKEVLVKLSDIENYLVYLINLVKEKHNDTN